MRFLLTFLLVAFWANPGNAAQLFIVDNYACGSTQDWKDSGLSYGESLSVKDVEFKYDGSTIGQKYVTFTITNKKSGRLPVHVHWVVRSEIDGNLTVVGAASSDFELKLMKPGDNRLNDTLHPMLSSNSKEFYGCLAVAYEE